VALPSCRAPAKAPDPDSEPAEASVEAAKKAPYTLPGLSHGLLQSPVNILSNAVEGGKHEIALNLHHADPELLDNKGHTIELDFPRGASITFDGREYELKQLHFHTPSEHQIDGITYPMEVHVVNMIEPVDEKDPPRYLVMSFLYRMGQEDPFISSFLDQVPSDEGSEELAPGTVDLDGRDAKYEYYHYRGSLTTPPYTETVDWLIVKEIQQASPEQIRRINLIEGDNARRVQALYGRKVED
jgi:carbonic anhydrase